MDNKVRLSLRATPIDLSDKDYIRFTKYIGEKNPDGCVEWTGAKSKNGYGSFGLLYQGRPVCLKPHRVAFWLNGNDLTNGLVIDHTCRNRACINPDHLREVSEAVNLKENSNAYGARTHCHKGHEFNENNTSRFKTKKGYSGRACIECRKIWKRERYVKLRKELEQKTGTNLRWNKSKYSHKEREEKV